jgi:T5orf172 domain
MTDPVIYISTSKEEKKHKIYTIGGSEMEHDLIPRLLAYNERVTSPDLKRYYVKIIDVNNFARAEKLIMKILGDYRIEGVHETFKISYHDLELIVSSMCHISNEIEKLH